MAHPEDKPRRRRAPLPIAARQLLGKTRNVIERCLALGITTIPIGEDIIDPDSTMSADAVKRKIATFEQLDEMRPRDVQDVGRLLAGEFLVVRDERDRLTVRHGFDDDPQGLERRVWDVDAFPVWT